MRDVLSGEMMDKRIQIWNVLHDGEISAIQQEGETLTMFVSIPYLRRRLRPLGDSFVLTLSGLTRVEFSNFDDTSSSLQDAIEIGSLEILSTESESMPVVIATTLGHLTLEFKEITFRQDTGETIEFETIDRVCEEYWTEWKVKTEQSN